MLKAITSRLFPDLRVTCEDPQLTAIQKLTLLIEQSMGVNGWDLIQDANTHDGPYCCIVAVADSTVINTVVGEYINGNGAPLPNGVPIPGFYSSIKLTSGKIIAFRSIS